MVRSAYELDYVYDWSHITEEKDKKKNAKETDQAGKIFLFKLKDEDKAKNK